MTAACTVFLIDFTVSTYSKTHKKLNKNKALERHWKNIIVSKEKKEIFKQKFPNDVQVGVLMLGNFTLAPLLAPLAPQVVFLLKKCSQRAPKVVPRLQK